MYPTWITGDGGPIIVLQSSAALAWDGTQTSETEETDYDTICALPAEGVQVIQRHDRDMLVLGDCEYACAFVTLSSGEIAVVQSFILEDDPQPFLETLRESDPDARYDIQVYDPTLRLLVGADVGDGRVYDYDDCPITPGSYQVWAYQDRPEALVAIFIPV